MREYTIALIQMECQFGKIEHNVQKAINYIEEAAKNGAKLVCLPESFNVGHDGKDVLKMKSLAEPLDGKTIARMREISRRLKIHLIASIIMLVDDGECENTSVFIDDNGNIIGIYSKTHPVGDERKYLKRGTEYPVWDTKLGKIGIAICYDACFPETTRILALKGAELIVVPSAWRATHYFKEWWDINISCRALDNLLYIAAINQVGTTGKGTEIFAGKTQFVNPVGQLLSTCNIEDEEILYQKVDLDRIEKDRELNTVLIDRHPEDYEILSLK